MTKLSIIGWRDLLARLKWDEQAEPRPVRQHGHDRPLANTASGAGADIDPLAVPEFRGSLERMRYEELRKGLKGGKE